MDSIRPSIRSLLIASIGFGVLFGILMILVFVAYPDNWLEEIWWQSDGFSPPLYGSLVFTVLLFVWWSIACWVSSRVECDHLNTSEIWMLAGSQVLYGSIGLVLWVAWDAVELENYHRFGAPPRDENLFERLLLDQMNPAIGTAPFEDERRLYGVWDIVGDQEPLPLGAKYLVFWRNERYQVLGKDYKIIEAGDARVSYGALRRRFETYFDWRNGLALYLHGDGVVSYSVTIRVATDEERGLDLTINGIITIAERIETIQRGSQKATIKLRNWRGVYSSYPIQITAEYPFYQEEDRSRSFRSKINPDALYP